MKNTLMFLLVSLLLAFSLTACGGGSQQSGAGSGTAGQTDGVNGDSSVSGSNGVSGTDGSVSGGSGVNGANGSNGSTAGTNGASNDSGVMPDSPLVDGARDILDDAGNAMDRAANNF